MPTRRKQPKRSRKAGKSKDERRPAVLADHRREGKRFVPPLLEALGDGLRAVRWLDDLIPELLWIGLLIDRLGLRRGVEVSKEFAAAAGSGWPKEPAPLVRASDYEGLEEGFWQKVCCSLSAEALADLREALWPLLGMYPECPMRPVLGEKWLATHRCDPESEVPYLKRVVSELSDKAGRKATLLQTTAIYIWGTLGNLRYMRGTEPGDLEELVRNPSSDESKKIAASLRATVNALGQGLLVTVGGWPECFWTQGLRISLCSMPDADAGPADRSSLTRRADAGAEFRVSLSEELERTWTMNLERIYGTGKQRAEVLGALLARQASLARAAVSGGLAWRVDIASVLLRCMAECRIALEWLARFGRDEDFERVVEYGLGQDKLVLEHLNARLADKEPGVEAMIESFRSNIEGERYTALLPVDVGQFWPKHVRDMATECECTEVFALYYQHLSSAVHGTWNALRQVNLVRCTNALHRFHYVPVFGGDVVAPSLADAAVDLMAETFEAWSSALDLSERKLESCETYASAVAGGGEHG